MSAVISADGLYRYSLTRKLNKLSGFGRCVFIMLNPSTADAKLDDPTIRRCKIFTASWGYDELVVVNLFALRATNPQDMFDSAEAGINIIGPENDGHILAACLKANRIVAAWGAHGKYMNRAANVRELLRENGGMRAVHLGLTKANMPRHPLYVKGDTKPEYLA